MQPGTNSDHLTPTASWDVLFNDPWAKEHHRRITSIDNRHYFLPHTLDEADAIDKIDRLADKSYIFIPAISYLEKKSMYHTHIQEARLAVIEAFGEHAMSALDESELTWQVIDYLQELPLNHTIGFSDVFNLEIEGTTERLTGLARRAETLAFKEGVGRDSLVRKRLIDIALDRPGRITTDLGELTAEQILNLARKTSNAEALRFSYWYSCLEDIATNSELSQMANTVLKRLQLRTGASIKTHSML